MSMFWCAFMPDVWTPDDLRFAVIRASHLEPPRQVASDLLAAAGQPAPRLAGVTGIQARLGAAEVLLRAGESGESVTVLRQVVQEAGPAADPRTQVAAADLFAEAGLPAEAESLVADVLRAHPANYALFGGLLAVSLGLASFCHFDEALGVADEVIACAVQLSGCRRGGPGARLTDLAELAKEQILGIQQEARGAGAELTDHQAIQERRDRERADLRERASSQPPWPALAGPGRRWPALACCGGPAPSMTG
jgi:hypothetical protein